MDIERYLQRATLVSDQVSKREVGIVLRELRRAIELTGGDVVEFGCFEGTTSVPMSLLLKDTDRTLYLYDSFEGLPEKLPQDHSPAGEQFKPGELNASKKNLITNLKKAGVNMPRIKKGWFSDLTVDDIPHHIAFAFLDGDYYESIQAPLRLIEPYLAPGATIVVDDYVNEALPGAAKAVNDWTRQKGYTIRTEASLAILRIPR